MQELRLGVDGGSPDSICPCFGLHLVVLGAALIDMRSNGWEHNLWTEFLERICDDRDWLICSNSACRRVLSSPPDTTACIG